MKEKDEEASAALEKCRNFEMQLNEAKVDTSQFLQIFKIFFLAFQRLFILVGTFGCLFAAPTEFFTIDGDCG